MSLYPHKNDIKEILYNNVPNKCFKLNGDTDQNLLETEIDIDEEEF